MQNTFRIMEQFTEQILFVVGRLLFGIICPLRCYAGRLLR